MLIIHITSITACLVLIACFLTLTEFRYSARTTFITMGLVMLLTTAAYLTLVNRGWAEGQASLACYSIPSLLVCLILSRYRDSRFIFTFCSVDLCGIILIYLTRIPVLYGCPFWLCFIIMLPLIFLMYYVVRKIRLEYLEIMRTLKNVWRRLAIISIVYYATAYFIMLYPKPLAERPEYFAILGIFLINMILTYTIIFQVVRNHLKLYDEEKERELLETQVTLQEKKLELQEMYEKLAYLDGLTGLKNRTAYEEKKKDLRNRRDRLDSLICMIADVNGLKRINDTFGHTTGDVIIKAVGELLQKALRNRGDVFRIGGDEFLAFLENEPREVTGQVSDDLQEAIKSYNAEHSPEIELAVGFAYAKKSAPMNLEELIATADKRMYEDKARRNSARDNGIS
ncbi:GGDEF domain-containing protein [Anaerolentibacter hominis]|uniref:GGDEF domain-containing protein n=1 Tax=Anaerolentibacter hominis TaxID=3079009 RepID=UPI0031B8434C